MNFLSNALSRNELHHHIHIFCIRISSLDSRTHVNFSSTSREQTNFCGLVFSSSFSAISRVIFADADPTLSNDSAKIRSGNGANPTPGHERTLPASLQDALSISAPQRRLTPFPARDGISLLNRIKTIRELPACRSCTVRASKRASDCSTLHSQSRRFSLTI